jgi:hypothetical protein
MEGSREKTYEPEYTPGFLPTITAYHRSSSWAVGPVGVESIEVMAVADQYKMRGLLIIAHVHWEDNGVESEGGGDAWTPYSASQSVDDELIEIASLS